MYRKGLTKLMFTKRCSCKKRSWATVILRTCFDKSCFLNSAEAVLFVAILTLIFLLKLAAPLLRSTVFSPLPMAADPFSHSLYIIQFSVLDVQLFVRHTAFVCGGNPCTKGL